LYRHKENIHEKKLSYTIEDLQYLMQRLRDKNDGCPWDIAQSYKSIASSTIEEMYEVIDAIESNNLDQLKDELGDLLFQIVFYAQLGTEDSAFDFTDVTTAITEKLLRRHPHVFPDGTLQSRRSSDVEMTAESIKDSWNKIKQQERGVKGQHSLMADIPKALPATMRAIKLQKRAASIGFDWPDTTGVYKKINEELAEVRDAVQQQLVIKQEQASNGDAVSVATDAVSEEIGDLLFSVINLSRYLKVEPETALRQANNKFEARFLQMEKTAVEEQTSLCEQDITKLEQWWQNTKV